MKFVQGNHIKYVQCDERISDLVLGMIAMYHKLNFLLLFLMTVGMIFFGDKLYYRYNYGVDYRNSL